MIVGETGASRETHKDTRRTSKLQAGKPFPPLNGTQNLLAVKRHCATIRRIITEGVCRRVCTSTGRSIYQLQPGRTEAAVGADAVAALASQTHAGVLAFIHICVCTHTQTHRRHQHDALGAAVNVRKAMHRLHERVTNYSRYTVTVHRNGRSQ